jgi:rubrerythrin
MPRKTRATLRRMSPLAREIAKLAGELAGESTRLMHLAEKVARIEHKATALDAYMVSTGKAATRWQCDGCNWDFSGEPEQISAAKASGACPNCGRASMDWGEED